MSLRPKFRFVAECFSFVFLLQITDLESAAFPPTATPDEIHNRLEKASRAHPRLFADAETFSHLKTSIYANRYSGMIADQVIQDAKKLMDVSPVSRVLQGRRLLGVSRRCLERVNQLAMAYQLTENKGFARRCIQEMLAVAAFEDWNPSHFLDVAEMTMALAVGYDWLYEELTVEERKIIRTAIVEKSLKLPFETRHKGWVKSRNNWGQVCHGGLTAGALAIMEDEPELAARTVHQAIQHVVHSMEAFAPKGSYPEGPGYWAYGTTYNVLLIEELENVLGTDFGLSQAPGFGQTGAYLALVTGPSGETFNYSDGGSGRSPQPAMHWFARRYQRPDWLIGEFELLNARIGSGGRFQPLTLLWMSEPTEKLDVRLPNHWQSEGEVSIALHRSSWTDPDHVFVGFKGGSPSANHGNMNIGSFVLDADGVRWAMDLGAEGYHGIESRGMNLWDRSQDSDRWTILRQSNHGHGTLVAGGQLQKASGFGRFVEFSDDPSISYSVLDMTEVYAGQLKQVLRGVALLPGKQVVIRDDISGGRPGQTIRWGMITRAVPTLLSDKVIRLELEDETLNIRFQSSLAGQWKFIDLEQPPHEWDSPNPGVTLLTYESEFGDDGSLTWVSVMTPGSAMGTDSKIKLLSQKTLENWKTIK